MDFLHYYTRIKCLTGAIISETHTRHKYIYYLHTILHMGPPSLRLHEDAGWIEGAADILGERPREAASAGVIGPEPV